MNDADHDLARQQGVELGEALESITALSVALRDSLKAFQENESVVNGERIEAWEQILEIHGHFDECPGCGTPTASGGICANCAGVTGE